MAFSLVIYFYSTQPALNVVFINKVHDIFHSLVVQNINLICLSPTDDNILVTIK